MNFLKYMTCMLILFSCSQLPDHDEALNEKKEIKNVISRQNTKMILPEDLDFREIINELAEIDFVLSGKDSIVQSTDPTELIVLNTLKSAFYSPFDSLKTGLEHYKDVGLIQKYELIEQGEKRQSNRSATIVLIQFQNQKKAQSWYEVFDQSMYKEVILNKPKTTLWVDENKIYFIQTYHTPNRECLDLLKNIILQKLKAHGKK